ncbi:hypothetical protein V2G26_019678 [Clonostachys chloroleuca]
MEGPLKFVCLFVWALPGQVAAKVADANTLAPDKFKRRTYHSVAVLRNHLYIEGGKISTYLNVEAASEREYDPVNTTLYIPLDVDWTNRTLELKEVQHAIGMPTVDRSGLWADERDGGAIYRWAGRRQLRQLVGKDDPKTLWKLETGSDGNGGWTPTTPGNIEGFNALIRTRDAASVSCDGPGLYIGGITDTATEYNRKTRAITGTLIYNMDSREWTTSSSREAFQPEGLHKVGTPPRTTGGPPLPRKFSYAIGAHGKNGTYEIFMYGGPLETTPRMTFGFSLFRASIGYKRTEPGLRAMGMGPKGGFKPVDEWYAGIGIFDLSALEWKDRYEANAEDYDSPSLVKAFYDSRGMDRVRWFNDTVKNLFLRDDGGFKSSNPTPLLDIGSSRSPPVAAIAGGVFGGAAVVVLVLARLWFWHRRWRPSAVEVVGIDVGVHGYSCGQPDANGTPKTELATRETHNSVTGWEAEAAGIPMPGMAARDALAFGCPGGAEMGSSAKGVGLLPRQSAERLAELEAPVQLQEMNS